jgi:tetratricopeptide (TPR) repeat protein
MPRLFPSLLLAPLLGCSTPEPPAVVSEPPQARAPADAEPRVEPSPPAPPPGMGFVVREKVRRLCERARAENDAAPFDEADQQIEAVLRVEPCDPDAWTARGQLAVERWRFEAARSGAESAPDPATLGHYEKALACRPEHAPALQGMGWYLEQIGDHEGALDAYRRVAAADPDDPGVHLVLGTALMQTGRFDEAVASLERVVAAYRERDDRMALMAALDKLGRAHIRLGHQERAEALLEESVALMQALKDEGQRDFAACPYVALGQLYRSSGDDAGGAAMFIRAADVEAHKPGAQFRAAQYLYWLGELEDAERYAQRALRLEERPEYAELLERVRAAAAGGEQEGMAAAAFDAAVRAFDRYAFAEAGAFAQRSLELEPSGDALVLAAMVALMEARYADVESLLEQAAGGSHDPCAVAIARGHLLVARKDYPGARAQLEGCVGREAGFEHARGLEMEPTGWAWTLYELGWLGLAWCHTNLAEHPRAIDAYDRVLRYQPTDRFALIGKGNALNALGDQDGAQAHLERVLTVDPDNMYAIAELGLVALNRGDVAAAEARFERALELEPSSYTCPHEGLGMVYMRQGRTEQAKVQFERAIAINPEIEFEKYNGLARIYMGEGRWDEAEALLRKSIENHPQDPRAARLLEELEALRGAAPQPPPAE